MSIEKLEFKDTDKTQPSKPKPEVKSTPTNDLGISDTLTALIGHANRVHSKDYPPKTSLQIRKILDRIGKLPIDTYNDFQFKSRIINNIKEQWYYLVAGGETKQKCVFVILRTNNNLLIARRNEHDDSSFAYLHDRSNSPDETRALVIEFLRLDSSRLLTATQPDGNTPDTAIFQSLALRNIGREFPKFPAFNKK